MSWIHKPCEIGGKYPPRLLFSYEHEVILVVPQTLMVLSTEAEYSLPREMARQVTLLSCLTSVCTQVMCSMFQTYNNQ